jgi:DNA polymerase
MLLIADYAGIEARGLAWCAGEARQLALFARGGDNYCDLATTIFGRAITRGMTRERAVGKQAVLGCGYGMGALRFAAGCTALGVDLAAAGTTAAAVVEGYRDAYPAVAGVKVSGGGRVWREGGLWKDVEAAAREALAKGHTSGAGRCTFSRDGGALVIGLPSGRRLCYRNARIEDRVPPYCQAQGLPPTPKPAIVYDSARQAGVVTYGARLVENIVQAICRDLLVAAMLACERQGLPVVLHVHDEVVPEVPATEAEEALRRLVTLMSTPPAWAEGFPLEVEGFVAERYLKSPPEGAVVLRARGGRLLGGD